MIHRVWLSLGVLTATAGVVVGVWQLPEEASWPLSWLLWAPVGFLILDKRPKNTVGIAAMLVGVGIGSGFILDAVVTSIGSSPVAAWLDLATQFLGVLPWLAILWLLLVFPTGTYRGTAEKVVGIGFLVYSAASIVAFALVSDVQPESGRPSPLAVDEPGAVVEFLAGEGGFFPVVVLLAATVGLLIRRWRSSRGVDRLQYQWLALAATVLVFVLLILVAWAPVGWLLVPAGWSIPSAIGVAILRYRLFEIDRVISRTLGYGIVIGALAMIYSAGAVWLPARLAGNDVSPLFVAGSTVLAAALFNPIRDRVLRWVDNRFYRSRYNAQLVLEDFVNQVRDVVDSNRLAADWVGVVTATMRPATVGVWIRAPRPRAP